jgi:hypothetical protein
VSDILRKIVPDPGPPPPPSPLELPRPRKPPRVRSELVPSGNGTHRTDEGVFVAKVDRHGRVSIEDKPNFNAHFALPSRRDLGEHLEGWYANPYGHATRDERAVETRTVKIVGGGFDMTDWAMRESGQDPYYYRKHAYLERTREERAGIAKTEERENLRDSLAWLSDFVRRIWEYDAWSAEKRRRVLFDLWDECAERGSKAVVDTADSARATIIAFIRRELPEGADDAYTADELRDLNANRTSRLRFTPYD